MGIGLRLRVVGEGASGNCRRVKGGEVNVPTSNYFGRDHVCSDGRRYESRWLSRVGDRDSGRVLRVQTRQARSWSGVTRCARRCMHVFPPEHAAGAGVMLYGVSNRTLPHGVRRKGGVDCALVLRALTVCLVVAAVFAATVVRAQSPTPSSYGDFAAQQTNQLLVLLLGLIFMLIAASQTKP